MAESGGIEPHTVSRTSRLAGGPDRHHGSLSNCTPGGSRTRTDLTAHWILSPACITSFTTGAFVLKEGIEPSRRSTRS